MGTDPLDLRPSGFGPFEFAVVQDKKTIGTVPVVFSFFLRGETI